MVQDRRRHQKQKTSNVFVVDVAIITLQIATATKRTITKRRAIVQSRRQQPSTFSVKRIGV